MNITNATRGIDALNRNLARFPNDTQDDYRTGKLVARDFTYFVRKTVTGIGAGIFEFLLPGDLETDGIRNFNTNRLPQGKNFAIESIRIAEGNHATSVDPKQMSNYTTLSTSVQAELRQALLYINQAGKRLIELPLSIILNNGLGILPGKDDSYNIDNPPVLVEQQPIDIQIKLPAAYGNFSASINKFHLEIMLNGKRTDPAYV